ncbi:uncharacterized protein DEA37_0007206, partial [Paragonimus westermani]
CHCPMSRHQELYETLVKNRGGHYTQLLRQRLNNALRIRREQFMDRVRSVQSDGTYLTNSATETEELRLLHEHRNLMRDLFDEAQAENIQLEVLLRLQDEVLDEFKEGKQNLSAFLCIEVSLLLFVLSTGYCCFCRFAVV